MKHPAPSQAMRIASRAAAAILGGYLLASASILACAAVLPGLRAEAVMTTSLLSYAIYTGAALWAFAARSARRAWLGLLAPSTVLLATAAAGHWTRGLP